MVGGINGYGNQVVSLLGNTKGTKETAAEKPVWDGKKSYTYLEDMNQAGLDYGVKAAKYYASKTAADGEMTVDDLKKQISEWFPDYTLTNREPNPHISIRTTGACSRKREESVGILSLR